MRITLALATALLAAPSMTAPTSAMATRVGASASLIKLMDDIVTIDSEDWGINYYKRGSIRNVKLDWISSDQQTAIVYADYTYNYVFTGWVKMRIYKGRVTCLRYHDVSHRCRPVGEQSPGGKAARAVANYAYSHPVEMAQIALKLNGN